MKKQGHRILEKEALGQEQKFTFTITYARIFNVKKKVFLLLFAVLLAAGVVVLKLTSTSAVNSANKSYLEAQESVEDYLKISVQPQKITQGKEVVFFITMESYQNPDILENDITELFLLEDEEENPYTPLNWKEKESTAYTRSGLLYFKIDKPISSLKLMVFSPEERSFTWDLR
ncbi:hypothetical protein ACFL96_01325 [Thermoproteota archaeon]